MRARAKLASLALALTACGCGVGAQLTADNGDLADYRAFRVAAHRGARLARAAAYLRSHPRGRFAGEVRADFEREEPLFFHDAQTSRREALEYLVDLPEGPHAAAVRAGYDAVDASAAKMGTLKLLADWRRTAALLDDAAERRKRFTETTLDAIGALLDPRVYGATLEELPAPLTRLLAGAGRRTWGTLPVRRDETFRFLLPTHDGNVLRVATLELSVKVVRDRVVAGRLWGPDLFARWTEADTASSVDDGRADARAEVARHVADVLGGALEATLPEGRCAAAVGDPEIILSRSCDGWTVIATMGAMPGAPDVIDVTHAARNPP